MNKFYKVNVNVNKYNSIIKGKDDIFGFSTNTNQKFEERVVIANSASEVYEKFGEENIKSVGKIEGVNLNSIGENEFAIPKNIRESKSTEEVAEYFRRVNFDRRSGSLIKEVKKMKADLEGEFGKFTEKANLLSEKQIELFDHLHKRFKDIKQIAGDAPGAAAMDVVIKSDGDIEYPNQTLKRMNREIDGGGSIKDRLVKLKSGQSDAKTILDKMPIFIGDVSDIHSGIKPKKYVKTVTGEKSTFDETINTEIPKFASDATMKEKTGIDAATLLNKASKTMFPDSDWGYSAMIFGDNNDIESKVLPDSYKHSFIKMFKGGVPQKEQYEAWAKNEAKTKGDKFDDVTNQIIIMPKYGKMSGQDVVTSLGTDLSDLKETRVGVKKNSIVIPSKLAKEVENMFEIESDLENTAESSKKDLEKKLNGSTVNEDVTN